jgi:hypothetical protein
MRTPNISRTPHIQAARRDTLVRCPTCGATVSRAARQQRFCSTRCRKRAIRGPARYQTSKNNFASLCEPLIENHGTNPPKNTNRNNAPQRGISGPKSVVQVEIVEARAWAEVVSSDGVRSLVSLVPPGLFAAGAEP